MTPGGDTTGGGIQPGNRYWISNLTTTGFTINFNGLVAPGVTFYYVVVE